MDFLVDRGGLRAAVAPRLTAAVVRADARVLRDFGLDDYYLELSTRDDASDKFIGSDEQWATATAVL